MIYIVLNKKVVSDSSGQPREFKSRQAARNFNRGRLGGEGQIVDTIQGIIGRVRVNIDSRPATCSRR